MAVPPAVEDPPESKELRAASVAPALTANTDTAVAASAACRRRRRAGTARRR